VAAVSAAVRRTLKVASAAADRLRPDVEGVVVLLYHRVGGGSALEIDLDAARFEEQIAAIAASGRARSLGTALGQLAAAPSEHPAESSVVVTFDDGTADFAEVAAPILERHRVPATLYLATGFVDAEVAIPSGGQPVSWSALRDACSTGLIDIGSHTHTHCLLDRVSRAEAATELDRSIDLIGDHLGQPALDFAYPKAVPARGDVARLVADRFRSAALAGTRVNPYRSDQPRRATDPHRLARSPIQVSDGMDFFARKLAGGMGLEDAFRRAINRVRYNRLAT
jgi:peptidoglycan/xylan/chitin deacetylase (PgdA/CDA1 family)